MADEEWVSVATYLILIHPQAPWRRQELHHIIEALLRIARAGWAWWMLLTTFRRWAADRQHTHRAK